MKEKTKIASVVLLFIYCFAILHSIVPHHHHGNIEQHGCSESESAHETHVSILHFDACKQSNTHEPVCHFSDLFSKANFSTDFTSSFENNLFSNLTTSKELKSYLKYSRLLKPSVNHLQLRAPPTA